VTDTEIGRDEQSLLRIVLYCIWAFS